MSDSFRQAIGKKQTFQVLEQEVFLHLWRTMDLLHEIHDAFFARFKLTPQQYNILRILRGNHPTPLTVTEVRNHLIARTPDVSRLVARLLKRGLVSRQRPEYDRRVVHIRLTAKARRLLSRMDEPLLDCHRAQLSHVANKQLRMLDDLLDAVREPLEHRRGSAKFIC